MKLKILMRDKKNKKTTTCFQFKLLLKETKSNMPRTNKLRLECSQTLHGKSFQLRKNWKMQEWAGQIPWTSAYIANKAWDSKWQGYCSGVLGLKYINDFLYHQWYPRLEISNKVWQLQNVSMWCCFYFPSLGDDW